MKALKRVLLTLLICLISYIIVTTICENISIDNKVKDLKENCILDETASTEYSKFYYKDGNNRGKELLGSYCDILVTTDSSVEIPIIHDVLSTLVGGHAALCGIYYQDQYIRISDEQVIDTTSNNLEKTATISPKYSWTDTHDFPNYYVLRVKLTEQEADIVFNEAVSFLGDPYNETFIFNTDKTHYCSDLIKKCFDKVNIDLNPDSLGTTVTDILASKKCELIVYKYIENGISYFYVK